MLSVWSPTLSGPALTSLQIASSLTKPLMVSVVSEPGALYEIF